MCAAICRSVTLKYMTFIMSHPLHYGLESIEAENIFIDCRGKYEREPFINNIDCPEHIVDLSKAGVLAWPWDKNRLQNFMSFSNDFNYNPVKQKVILIKPFDIYVVSEYGNHAITKAMFFRSGKMKCNEAIDYTPLLNELELQDNYFITRNKVKKEKSSLLKKNPEFETLFLLGKKIIKFDKFSMNYSE